MKNQKWIVLLAFIAISTSAFSQVGVVNCDPPGRTVISSASYNGAVLAWTPGENTTNWVIEVGLSGFSPGANRQTNLYYHSILTPTPRIFKGLSGLEMGTNYDLYIRSDCDENGNSIWTGPFTFTTRNYINIDIER